MPVPGQSGAGAPAGRSESRTRPQHSQEQLLRRAIEAVAVQDALTDARDAASAARAAALRAEDRAAALDRSVAALRDEAHADRTALVAARQQLARVDASAAREPAYWAALAALGALTSWLGVRLHTLHGARRLARRRRSGSRGPAIAAGHAGVRPSMPPSTPGSMPGSMPSAAQASLAGRAASRAGAGDSAISADELIDLEQQAEFFMVLGDRGSAAGLLVAHLDAQPDASPLVYLKLLEVYGRGRDRDAFEAVRRRFAERFDLAAPPWSDALADGPGLLADPQAVARITQVWNEPAQAMDELQSLLAGRDGRSLTDLPSCRDALLLYAMARDLQQPHGDAAPGVDLWLPLDDDASPVAAPLPQPAAARAADPTDLDLDLSVPMAAATQGLPPPARH